MSDIESASYSESAGGNNAASPNGAPEGMAPSGVNDTIREIMAAIKRDWNRSHPTVTSGGAANAQTLTYATAPAGYFQGQRFCFIAGFTTTGAATLNVNGIGAKNIFMDGVALIGGEIVAGSVVEMVYDGTQFQITSSRAPGTFPTGFKNWLINGDFDIWQRGAGGSASIPVGASSATYVADRWCLTTTNNNSHTVSQQAGLTSGSRFCVRVQRNAGQTGTAVLLETALTTDMLVPLRGQMVTLSLKVRSGANFSPTSGAFAASFIVGTGAEARQGVGFIGQTTVATTTTSLGTSSAVTTVTKTSAAVVPINTTQGSVIISWNPTGTAGANDYIEIDEVQPEIGGIATAFDRRPLLDELARCKRFCRKSFLYPTAPAQNVGGGTNEVVFPAMNAGAAADMIPVRFDVSMRVAPTLTLYNPGSGNAQARDETHSADCSATTAAGVNADGFYITATGNASSTVGSILGLHYLADADL
jgi:hypothetical protein